jgi:heme exporter protein CcmD
MKPGGLQAFLSMGGYAFYVWTSYAVVALAIVIEIIAVRARLRRAARSAAPSDRAPLLHDDTQ